MFVRNTGTPTGLALTEPFGVLYFLGLHGPMSSWLGTCVCPRSNLQQRRQISEPEAQLRLCSYALVLYSIHAHLLETISLLETTLLDWLILGLGVLCLNLHNRHIWFAKFRNASFSSL